jgi:hypothetical protein
VAESSFSIAVSHSGSPLYAFRKSRHVLLAVVRRLQRLAVGEHDPLVEFQGPGQ